MASIPKQYRITLKAQLDYLRDEQGQYIRDKDGRAITTENSPPLGFANVYEPHTKAYPKRKHTQDQWAYGLPYHGDTYIDDNGVVFSKTYKWEEQEPTAENNFSKHKQVWSETKVADHLQPIIIDNVPLEGFKIQRSVSRYSTSNKVWRVLDPRGFELEINTGTFEDLVMGTTIEQGLIHGACIWKTAKMLVLVK